MSFTALQLHVTVTRRIVCENGVSREESDDHLDCPPHPAAPLMEPIVVDDETTTTTTVVDARAPPSGKPRTRILCPPCYWRSANKGGKHRPNRTDRVPVQSQGSKKWHLLLKE